MKFVQQDGDFAPFDLEIEQAVLGALLVDNALINAAAAELEPEHFSNVLHQRLYEMIVFLQVEGAVSPLILFSVMKTDPDLKTLDGGGKDYLVELARFAPAPANLPEMMRMLIDLASRRQCMQIAVRLANDAVTPPKDAPTVKIAARATDGLFSLGRGRRQSLKTLGDAAGGSLQRLEDRLSGKGPKPISTGLLKLDRVIGGFMPGDRIGIAARTGMGKSILSSSLSTACAMDGAPVFIASADMRESQWAERVICDVDRYRHPELKPIHYTRFRTGIFSEDEWARVVLARQEIDGLPISIDDSPAINLAAIRGRTRAMSMAFPNRPGVLVVDFLQKVESDRNDRRRDEDLTAIAYGLGDIVRDVGWTLLVLIQITNKDTDTKGQMREDPPNVTAIRESGGIEMALDIIVSPFRKAFFIERRHEDFAVKNLALAEPCKAGWAVKHHMQLLGWKNRDGRASDLNLDLWCDPGSASVRDEEPKKHDAVDQAAEQAADQLAMTV